MKTEKLQKLLANAGLGSRRQLETFIEQGRVKVNGELAKLGDRATTNDTICLDDEPVQLVKRFKTRVLVYNKPVGEVCSRADEKDRQTVFEQLPELKTGRWISVGRLDINTSGLLFFTNDGALAHALMHPSQQIDREYAVRVLGEVSNEALGKLLQGVQLEDGRAEFHQVLAKGGQGANEWYRVVLREGRNREVRRLWESQGLTVSRLIRVRYGMISLSRDLEPGGWQELPSSKVRKLAKLAGVEVSI